jgi:type VI secretion system protein ImpL
MALLKKIFLSRMFLYIVGMLVAAVLIWFIGPLIGVGDSTPLSGVLQRTLAIVLIPAILGLGATFSAVRLRQNNAALEQSLTESPKGKAAEAANEDVADLGKRLKEALALLKKSKMRKTWGNGWLYQLPWYMFIGPPGSGKTTALVNSGLSFPLAEQYGKNALRGVGGTRSCDWWFTDDAVLIDTAGRYTTQDSEAEADAGAWTGFLRLLKKNRKRQPINGALVAIGLSDLLYATEDQRAGHARAIRARLKELYAELGVRFPVYALFTKADLIAGFVEFFEDLSREDREQVWGMTFETAKSDNPDGVVSEYPGEFDALIGRLNDRLLERTQQETDIQRRALIFGFPQQVASLKEITDSFLKSVFQPNRFEEPARLRGVYFTSGTQEGTPIDRLMGAMAASFGISRQQVAGVSGSGRSYFLTRLLKTVIFGEAGLVSADAKLEQRNRMIRYGVMGAAAVGILVMVGAWIATYFNNSELIGKVDEQAAAYNEQAKNLQLEPVNNSDLQPVLPLLALLREMPGGYAHQKDDVPLFLKLGLYQGDKLGSQAVNAYRMQLGRLMLPRMILRLEGQLADHQNQPDFLYEALKVYLILGSQGKMDKSLVKTWMDLDWRAQFPGPENETTVDALNDHLDALLEKPLPAVALDANLVEQTRAVLRRVPLAERAYSLIKTQPEITALPPWRLSEHGGPAVARALVRKSGKPLSDGIPGLYTHDGYYYGFKPLLPNIAREVTKESWVIGQSSNLLEQPAAVANLQKDVIALYLEDFAAQWDRLLADIAVAPITSLSQAAPLLNVLSAPDSPLKAVWVSAANETWLSKPPSGPPPANPNALLSAASQAAMQAAPKPGGGGSGGGAGGGPGGGAKTLAEQQLTSVLGAPAPGTEDIAASFTDKRFKPLHDMVAGSGNAPPAIDGVMTDLDGLYRSVNAAGASGDAAKALTGGGGGDAAAKLQSDAERLPDSVKPVVVAVAASTSSLAVGGARAQLNGLWTSSVVPFCQSALENRYPAFSSATNEVTLDDFSRLFSKGGLIDAFFDANLRAFVDMSKNPWAWQRVENTDLGIPPAVLAQFQRAAAIRDSMFPGGGAKPGVNFDIVPISLDPKSTQVTLEIDGQTVSYDNGPTRPVKVSWPGPSGIGHVRVSFQPQAAGETTTVEKDGTWAWFRMLETSQMKQTTGADRYQVTFKAGDRSAAFEIRANSVINPFASNMLGLFRCPPRL